MQYRTFATSIAGLVISCSIAWADEPARVPLTTLGTGTYLGSQGGLYAGGVNQPPEKHAEALKRAATRITPRKADGQADAGGKIVLLSIGASTGRQIMAGIIAQSQEAKGVNPAVVLVNGNVGGQDINKIADLEGRYWPAVDSALDSTGVTAAQVQAAWMQEDDLRDADATFPGRPQRLKEKFAGVMRLLKQKFPNQQVCYLVDRHTTAFAQDVGKEKHAEPRPNHVGWAVKWLIEDQMNGLADLAFEGDKPSAPLLTWGPYFWTDGDKSRDDGYRWTPENVVPDGVHLSEAGQQRVGGELLKFFSTDPYARLWFAAPQASAPVAGKPVSPAWIVNGKNKLPKLLRLLGTDDAVRVEAHDLDGKKLWELDDICHRATDLNQHLKSGEYTLKFFGRDGKQITLTQEVGEVLKIK